MVSPWMENGNIVRYTTSKKACQSTIDVMLREVATGLEYLHARGFIHGDIRGANILVDQDLHPCIADFGLAHLSDMSHSNTGSGSARWMAPELHDPRTFGLEHSVRTRQSDVFAFGMLCLEVKLPFLGLTW
ncbi:kinase-like protein [Heliocybe sulcata]|uniref:Kinase-like protein n=1 Tax=Heliocybe sulcata TaxID=5364 RepID=A0A5C3MMC1_9AGAM|nr:kinase-like protein [Heliocybe sulcata]